MLTRVGPPPTHLLNDVAELALHLVLGTLEALPQVVADAAPEQQRAAGLLGRLDLDEALNVFDGAAQERGAEDAVGHARRLFAVGAEVQQGEVDVALEVGAEPGREVGALGWTEEGERPVSPRERIDGGAAEGPAGRRGGGEGEGESGGEGGLGGIPARR